MSDSLRGSRPGSEYSTPKQYSLNSLFLAEGEGNDLLDLYRAVRDNGANCESDPDRWTGDDLPSDREAQRKCAGCPALKQCRAYAEKHNPAHGVWGGAVYGREEDEE